MWERTLCAAIVTDRKVSGGSHLARGLPQHAAAPQAALEGKGWSASFATHRPRLCTRLIERSLAQNLGGKATIELAPAGVVCTVDTPITKPKDMADLSPA